MYVLWIINKYKVIFYLNVLRLKCFFKDISFKHLIQKTLTLCFRKTSFHYFLNKYNTKRSLYQQRRKCSWKIKARDCSKLNIYLLLNVLCYTCLVRSARLQSRQVSWLTEKVLVLLSVSTDHLLVKKLCLLVSEVGSL